MGLSSDLRAYFDVERPLADRLRGAGSKAERRALYGPVYAAYREQISALPTSEHADTREASIASQEALVRPFLKASWTFVELGAGDGAVAARLAPSVRHAIAFDVTDAIAVSGPPGFEFRVFDGFELGLPPESVDFVFSNDLVEHLHPDDASDQMRAVRDVLKPGGKYLCVTPNRLWGPHDVSRSFAESPQGFHLREYTAVELAAALREAGFRRVDIFLSWKGRRFSPLLPVAAVVPVELLFAALPRRLRLRGGVLLAAFKVIATR